GCKVEIASGTIRALSLPFYEFSGTAGHNCLWFELQDYIDVNALAVDIMRVMALRIGRFQLQHVSLYPIITSLLSESLQTLKERWIGRVRAQFAEWRLDPSHWTLFIYGRDEPGANAGWLPTKWSTNDYQHFELLREALTELRLRIVYAPS